MSQKHHAFASGLAALGSGTLAHSVCCGVLPVLVAGAAQTGSAVTTHAHEAISMGATLGVGALTTAVIATGLTYWQQRHTQKTDDCAKGCAPHNAHSKKDGATWGRVWAKHALVGAVSFLAMQGIMHATDFNRETETVYIQPDTQQVLVVDDNKTS